MSSSFLRSQPPLRFCCDGLPLLTAYTLLPDPGERLPPPMALYYRLCLRRFTDRCRRQWFPAAQDAYRQALQTAAPLPQWQAELRAAVTLLRPPLISLRLDTVLTGPPRRLHTVRGDVWDLRTGLPLALSDCFPPRSRWRRYLLRHAADSIQAQEARFHPTWRQVLPRAFRPRNFYLTEEGLCFFFPPDTIAPAAAGCPTFCLPYDDKAGPFVPKM